MAETTPALCPECGNGMAVRAATENTPPAPWLKPEWGQMYCESCGYSEDPRLYCDKEIDHAES